VLSLLQNQISRCHGSEFWRVAGYFRFL